MSNSPSTSSSIRPLLSPTMSSQQTSRASRSFLGVIKETVRNRSRSPAPPPKSAQPESSTRKQTITQPAPRPAASHRNSSASTASSTSMRRTSSQSSQGSTERTAFDRISYGRHSSDVCFTLATAYSKSLIDISGCSPHKKALNNKAPADPTLNHNILHDLF